jgi:hypothetical protein
MTAPVDTAPSVPFDLTTVAFTVPPLLDLDLMSAIAEDAGRAAACGSEESPFDASPAMRTVCANPDGGRMVSAARLYRAAYRGALDPGMD